MGPAVKRFDRIQRLPTSRLKEFNECNAITVYWRDKPGRLSFMASITVRNLEEGLKRRLRVRAAEHGRSMEQEVREILAEALAREPATGEDLARAIRGRFAPLGGVDLVLPAREPIPSSPQLD